MGVRKIGVQSALPPAKAGLAEKLAEKLKSDTDYGQPTVYEQEYSTKKVRVTVIWDEWADASLEDRSAIIVKAYEIAQGLPARERIALASGLSVPEASASGMLPYQIIPALRKGDPVTLEQAAQALLEEGASKLINPRDLQLRFATEEEAEASRQRLIKRFPDSDDVWLIRKDLGGD